MFKKILVPLDGSEIAEQCLPYARLLAEKLDCEVELLQVIDPGTDDEWLDGSNEQNGGCADRYLSRIAKSFPVQRLHFRARRGIPAEIILETGAQCPDALIVMASHGRSGVGRWLLGSVAEKVLRAASNPLLIVRAAETDWASGPAELGSVLVPLDGSKLAESVLEKVVELARRLQLEIVLVSAYQIPSTAYYRGADDTAAAAFIPTRQELVEAMSRDARLYIDAKVKELSAQVERVRGEVVEGPAADRIIDLARSMKGALIAMCTHGHSGIRRWVLGSVTEKVTRHADVPVMVIGAR